MLTSTSTVADLELELQKRGVSITLQTQRGRWLCTMYDRQIAYEGTGFYLWEAVNAATTRHEIVSRNRKA